ncbi:hypothetical protein [Dyadobacter psychrotolerans]|uniref:Uncharacterized protein n=1 Tax=Dyadobacter psychrotolerans TaxID=2541721 RepID=A0A4R5DKU9_9BACT|nr:hypothetical protein [Dyadobacter psychrotolerans]TDE14816.1 hypothetical protein E0F88_16670 [Dyadobacter psychrotolerans]
MNQTFFFKTIAILSIITVLSVLFGVNVPEGEETILTFAFSLPALFIAAPYLWWIMLFNHASIGEGSFTAALILDIILYSFIIERISAYIQKWKKKN